MGVFDSMVLQASNGFASYAPDHDYWFTSREGAVTSAGMAVSEEGARKLSAWFRGRDLLTTAVAMAPLDVFERLANDQGSEKAREMPLYDVLHRKPNPWQDSYTWRRMKTGHVIDHGNAYDLVVGGRRGYVDELWPLHPKTVTPQQLASGRVLYHHRDPQTQLVTTYVQEQIFHLRGASDDGVVGKGILQYARENLGLGLAIENYASKVFGRGTVNGGIIETPGKLAPDVAKAMAERFATKPGEWAMPKVLEQGAKWIKPELSPEDFQMILSRKHTIDDMARWLGVPRHMLENSDPSFGNAEQFNQNFETFTVGPWFSLWEFAINDQLITAPKRFYAEFNRDAFRRSSFLERWQGHQIAVSTGTFTRNEVRRTENRNALPGLDTPLDPAHLTGKQEPAPAGDKKPPAKKAAPIEEDDDQAQAIAVEAASRILRKEIRTVRELSVKHARSQQAFSFALKDFYEKHQALVAESLCMSALESRAYCEGQLEQVKGGLKVLEQWQGIDYARGLAAWALNGKAAA